MSKKPRTRFQIGRDAVTGKFISVAQAKRRPRRSVVETVPLAGAARLAQAAGCSRRRR